ncbi:hypothetical protein KTD31_02265 [Burkholderia multivorans]|jgi:hypothetical protein|uniref:hypothetical protein n=1 Tax=Burkholderia multivorans TaxID=87883 RepID=UPI001C23A4F8|nr:hypothetical protein [Burkholderia multivorans]MBU9200230.1 hypothetical protein [Burkholderia multivorans]MDN8078643.1 hypothetical protein [Burkholderia multivorans]
MLAVLFSLFRLFDSPKLASGDRVNLILNGAVVLSDGVVVAQSRRGVFVDWPNGRSDWFSPRSLSRQIQEDELKFA